MKSAHDDDDFELSIKTSLVYGGLWRCLNYEKHNSEKHNFPKDSLRLMHQDEKKRRRRKG